jgi:putative hydrolase of the HAD superfamily
LLIIFDLDDTLIDTTGFITPFKLKKVLAQMLGRNPSLPEIEELMAINEKAFKTQEALATFASRYALPLDRTFAELSSPLPKDFHIPCTPHAKQMLEFYTQKMPIALVTGGHPPFQLEKLEKAGIDEALFSKIAIPEDSVKKPFYQEISRDFSVDPSKIWVCGDRIPMDLVPAKELGCKTIHMRWGRGLKMETLSWIDFSISNLSELQRIIP